MISFKILRGDRLITECTVLSRVLHASLWKTMMTEVVGNSSILYVISLHLHKDLIKLINVKNSLFFYTLTVAF